MKKTIIAVIIFSLLFTFAGVTLAQELEKIPSPDQIINFRVLKKEGNALFGIRLKPEASSANRDEKPTQSPSGTNSAAGSGVYEKISHPSQINLFEKIKQVGVALWGLRKGESEKSISKTPLFIQPAAAQCVKNALDKKDDSLKSAISAYSNSTQNAISARNLCQKTAIDLTTGEEQMAANRLCVSAYQAGMKTSNENLRIAKNNSWKIFKDDLKICSTQQIANGSSTITAAGLNLEIIIDDGENTIEDIR